MNNFTRNLKTRRFAVIAVSVTVLGILFGAVVGRSGPAGLFSRRVAQKDELRVTNKTSAIRVVGMHQRSMGKNEVLFVAVQNISDRNIKAYTIARGKAWVTKSYLLSEESFAPNAIEEQIIPLTSGAFSAGDEKEFSVTAVLFEDGNGDGDAIFLSRLSETHAGMRDQADRLLPCLERLASAREFDQKPVLSACESEAVRMPVAGTGRSSDYENGLQNVQREILTQLTDIKDKVDSRNFADATSKKDKVTRIMKHLASPSRINLLALQWVDEFRTGSNSDRHSTRQ
jgi:hypothetical protein